MPRDTDFGVPVQCDSEVCMRPTTQGAQRRGCAPSPTPPSAASRAPTSASFCATASTSAPTTSSASCSAIASSSVSPRSAHASSAAATFYSAVTPHSPTEPATPRHRRRRLAVKTPLNCVSLSLFPSLSSLLAHVLRSLFSLFPAPSHLWARGVSLFLPAQRAVPSSRAALATGVSVVLV